MTGVYRPVLLPDGDGGDDTDALDELDSLMQDLDDLSLIHISEPTRPY